MEINSVDDFALAVPLNSEIICVVKFVKVWVVNKKYGLTIKLVRVNVLPGEKQKPVMESDIEFD